MKNTLQALLVASALTSAGFLALPIGANDKPTKTFVEMAKSNPDGKIEKGRVLAMMDKAFDRFDTQKEGKLDARQARQFELFLREFTRESGG